MNHQRRVADNDDIPCLKINDILWWPLYDSMICQASSTEDFICVQRSCLLPPPLLSIPASLQVPSFLPASHTASSKNKVSWVVLWICEVNFSSYYCLLLLSTASSYSLFACPMGLSSIFETRLLRVNRYRGNNSLAHALLLLLLWCVPSYCYYCGTVIPLLLALVNLAVPGT